jgi:hypothetical protein
MNDKINLENPNPSEFGYINGIWTIDGGEQAYIMAMVYYEFQLKENK